MEFLPDQQALLLWLTAYGSFALFGLLACGIIALPVPEETLMVLAGIMIDKGHLALVPTLLAAYAGSMTGITVSYLLGRVAGDFLIKKYGGWIGLTEKRLQQMHNWFARYGKWTLMIGYFIPGLRHWTGVFAGITRLEYPYFALFAYMGAFIWVSFFIFIGYFFGSYWLPYFEKFELKIDAVSVLISLTVAAFLAWRFWPNGRKA